MECLIVSESYKASTKLLQARPEQIEKIEGAHNQTVAFQILLHNGQKNHYLLNEQFSIPDEIETPMYRVAINTKLNYQAQFVEYYLAKDNISYADKLIEEKSYTFDGDRYAPIYVEIPIDEKVSKKTYSIEILVFQSFINQDDRLIAREKIDLAISDFKFPKNTKENFKLDIWQQPSNLARTFKVPLFGDEHFKLIDQMAKILADIGQKSVTIIAGEIPWKGWFNYIVKDFPANLYEYSIVPIKRNKNGEIICDFSLLDRYINSFFKYGIDWEINIFGLLGVWTPPFFPLNNDMEHPEKLVLRYFDEESSKMKFIKDKEDFQTYFRLLVDHMIELGLWDKTYFNADEPKFNEVDKFKSSLKALKEIEPSLKIKVAFDKESVLEALIEDVDYPVTSFYCTSKHYKELTEKFHDKTQYYICNYPTKPNTFLHSPLLEARVQGALAYYLRTNGLLRWAFNCWPTHARTDIRYNTAALPIGDNCLVYPGYNGNILLSLRYKQLKRGIEDYWLLKELAKYDWQTAEEIVSEFLENKRPDEWMIDSHVTNSEVFNLSENQFYSLRQTVLQKLTQVK